VVFVTVSGRIFRWLERRWWECPRCGVRMPYQVGEAYRPWVCKGRMGDHGDYRPAGGREETMQEAYLKKVRSEARSRF